MKRKTASVLTFNETPLLLTNLLITVILLATVLYALFLLGVIRYWSVGKQAYQRIYAKQKRAQYPFFSILVPARNEATNIEACLKAIRRQDYPADRLEIIVLDDHSEDGTAQQVALLTNDRLRLVALSTNEHGKKAALRKGIAAATGEVILTTDADCTMSETWLRSIACLFQEGNDMVLGPVRIAGAKRGLLYSWQGLDICGTLLMTGAAVSARHPILANGANFAFRKSLFNKLNGFSGNAHYASGDDIFLLQKAVQKNKSNIAFVFHREAAVVTQATESWTALFWQRLRWASKTSGYTDAYLLAFQAGVYLLNIALLLGVVLIPVQPDIGVWIGLAWGIKGLAEYVYLRYASRELGNPSWLRSFLISFLIHTLYVTVIGTLALFPLKGKWKGRIIS